MDRIISGNLQEEDNTLDRTLRPTRLSDYVGQELLKQNLTIGIKAARMRGEPLDHILMYGPPGLGKTTLANILSHEMEVNVRVTSGPAIERPGDLAAILTNLNAHDILFIDEIHRLNRTVEEVLYPALEEFAIDVIMGRGPGARSLRLHLKPFTLVGATTRFAMLSAPLRDRFGSIHRLDFYSQGEILDILRRSSKILQIHGEDNGLEEIARRSRGTPRVANRLLRRVRDYAQVEGEGIINKEISLTALDLLQIDALGLEQIDHKVLLAVIEKFDGGPVGLETIAASVSEEADTVMDVYEPYLIQLGFLERTPRGRVATRHAYQHLGVEYPREKLDNSQQGNLF